MRKEFSDSIEKIALEDSSVIFITGDLGYKAFENLQQVLKDRFINAGVAEQGMVGMAAGLASQGYKVFCYSIAPFIVYRCLEQYRNDVCLHKLPVFLVGNGGGYGYGIMGSTHHAIEDIACMSSMPNSKCWTPAFNNEVEVTLRKIIAEAKPAYLRLNNSTSSPSEFSQSHCINSVIKSEHARGTIVTAGSIINNVLQSLADQTLSGHFDLFSVSYFPLKLSDEFIASVRGTKKLIVLEEHVFAGGLAQQLSAQLMRDGVKVDEFVSLHAQGYPDALYGDQNYHHIQSGIDSAAILKNLVKML